MDDHGVEAPIGEGQAATVRFLERQVRGAGTELARLLEQERRRVDAEDLPTPGQPAIVRAMAPVPQPISSTPALPASSRSAR
jgi:hypothetical protein